MAKYLIVVLKHSETRTFLKPQLPQLYEDILSNLKKIHAKASLHLKVIQISEFMYLLTKGTYIEANNIKISIHRVRTVSYTHSHIVASEDCRDEEIMIYS